jgi:hypothetical protein
VNDLTGHSLRRRFKRAGPVRSPIRPPAKHASAGGPVGSGQGGSGQDASERRVFETGTQKIRYMRMMSVIGTPISQRIKPVMAAFFP